MPVRLMFINVNASNVLAGTLTGMTLRGGRVEALNGKMNIDLQKGQYNVLIMSYNQTD